MSRMSQARRALLCASAASLLLPISGAAQWLRYFQQSSLQLKGTHSPENQASSPVSKSATLADFTWLEGHWRGDWGPRTAEQVWMAPKSGLMLGSFRLVEDDRTLLVEIYTLAQGHDGIELRFRHFTPALAPWEKSDPGLLKLESFDGTRFVFDNPENGEPKHAIFTRINPDTYLSRFEILPSGGKTQVVAITYHRVKPPHS